MMNTVTRMSERFWAVHCNRRAEKRRRTERRKKEEKRERENDQGERMKSRQERVLWRSVPRDPKPLHCILYRQGRVVVYGFA